jgi:hypothetical protein
MSRRMKLASVLVAAAGLFASVIMVTPASANVTEFGLESVAASLSSAQAGGHPDFATTFVVKGNLAEADAFGNGKPFAETRDVKVELSPGLVANLGGIPACPVDQFSTIIGGLGNIPLGGSCGPGTQVGIVRFSLYGGQPNAPASLYRLPAPPGGDIVARFGFWATITPVVIDVKANPERDYAATATASGLTAAQTILPTRVATTIWGNPTSVSHDGERMTPKEAIEWPKCEGKLEGCFPSRPDGLAPTAFMRNSTSCGPNEVFITADSYQVPGVFITPVSAVLPEIIGCALVPFEPVLSLKPTTRSAGSASGVDFSLKLPQDGISDPKAVSNADLKKAVVRLPENVGLNASAAEGLGSCSEEQVGLISESPIRFNGNEPACPESSKIGSATITTPILEEPLEGSLYIAKQGNNPFHSLLAGYLAAKANGIVIKVAGKFELSPSGRITGVFDGNPQAPFSDLELHFKGGSRGVLTMPSQCGTYQTEYELTPWSGNAPVTGTSPFTIDENCGGAFNPGFEAGTTNPVAGKYSPFTMRLTREPGSPLFTGLSVTPPAGLVAKLAGVPYCSDSALAGISSAPGSGALEIASPSCPAASQVGGVTAGAGSGSPFYVSTGKAYLAGPYKGAPLSLAVVTPAVAGPFDLGNVVVRAALQIDPETAQVHAVSDPLPTVVQGIPLDLRDVRVNLDRKDFALNPTSCKEMQVGANLTASTGAVASPSSRFQVGNCANLGFKPKLSLHLFGKANRGSHPRLKAVLTARKGDANIGRAQVSLPRSEFIDQAHFKTICTRVQFAANECPAGSVYGHAKAWTPLLASPLEGPVYLRSSNHTLPDLVIALNGQVDFDAVARIDSVHGGLRSTFETVPDAPISRFVLNMQGGKKGLFVNSRNICEEPASVRAGFTAHNGRRLTLNPPLAIACGNGH